MIISLFEFFDWIDLVGPAVALLFALREHWKLRKLEYDRGDLVEDDVVYQYSSSPFLWEEIFEKRVRATGRAVWTFVFVATFLLFAPDSWRWLKDFL